MQHKRQVILVHAPDADEIAMRIRDLLREEPVAITSDCSPLPDPWDEAVVLFVLSAEALADDRLATYARQVFERDLPLVPVVEDLRTYRFDSLPSAFAGVSERNACGLQPGDGAGIRTSVQANLGLPTFTHGKKVFISYCRSDGERPAEEIYEALWERKFTAFMDTKQIEGGEIVQERIFTAIDDKDFVLLIDSPNAESSPWVQEEILRAHTKRIPVRVVSTSPDTSFPFTTDYPRIEWDEADDRFYDKLILLVARGIAAQQSLDSRATRTVGQLAALKQVEIETVAPRRYRLARNATQVLVEYEDASVSVERLHRLYLAYQNLSGCERAIFICGDQEIIDITEEAIQWTCRDTPLAAMPLASLSSELNQLFP